MDDIHKQTMTRGASEKTVPADEGAYSLARAEIALRHREAELREAQRVARIGTWRWDATTDEMTGSTELYRIFGLDLAGSIPNFKSQGGALYPGESWERLNAAAMEALRTGMPYELDLEAFRDGERIWVTVRGQALHDGDHQMTGLRGTIQEITDRKRTEELFRESRDQMRLISDAIPALISYVDTQNRYRFCNAAYKDWFGMPPEQMIGRTLEDVLGSDAWKTVGPRMARAMNGEVVEYEAFTQYRTGPRWIHAVYTPHRDKDGRVLGLVVMVHDISEKKRTEQARRESEERYRSLFESIDEGFCVIEILFDEQQKPVDYLFVEVNPAFEKQAGMRGATGKRMREFVSDIESYWLENYGRVATTGEPIRFAAEYKSLGKWFDVYAFRVGEPAGCRVAVIFNDISERKQAERELLQSRAELAAANEQLASRATQLETLVQQRTKRLTETIGELEAFSYSISHDMRQPLRAMQQYAGILLEDFEPNLPAEAQQYLKRIAAGAHRMDRLIRDVLSYSRIARDEARSERVDLTRLVREIVEQYPGYQPPNADVEVCVPLLPVLGSEAALAQAVSNLFGNAVKFVVAGTKPRIRVWTEHLDPVPGSGTEANRVRLWVEDNGIGIAKEDQQRVWEIFERLHPVGKYDGTGIGLSIVRKAAERAGGRAGVESEPGKGSRFWLELPAASVS